MDDIASEIARLRVALAASEARAASAEADLAQVRAVVTTSEVMIRHLKLEIAKMRREQYGQSSERRARLIDRMELQLEKLADDATVEEIAAERVAATITNASAFERLRPTRKPFPEHLPRERLVIEAPSTCACCGSARIVKMGEDITETLEAIPRQWKVIQTVREKFTCRDCEKISQPPAPFHASPHGLAGPNLLATILFESEPGPPSVREPLANASLSNLTAGRSREDPCQSESRRVAWHPSGRCIRWLQRLLSCRPQLCAGDQRALLEPSMDAPDLARTKLAA